MAPNCRQPSRRAASQTQAGREWQLVVRVDMSNRCNKGRRRGKRLELAANRAALLQAAPGVLLAVMAVRSLPVHGWR